MIQHDSTIAAVFDDRGFQAIGLLIMWGTLLLGSAWLIAGLLVRGSAAVRYCVWQYAFLGSLAAPSAFLVLPGIPLGLMHVESASSSGNARLTTNSDPTLLAQNSYAVKDVRSFGPGMPDLMRRPDTLKSAAAMEEQGHERPFVANPARTLNAERMPRTARGEALPRLSWSAGLVVAWVLGVMMQFAWLVRCIGRAGRLIRVAETVDDPRIYAIQQEIQRRLSLSRPVRLLVSNAVGAPLVVGVRRPSIILPTDYGDWSVEKTRIVLSHELAHVERRDVFWQLVARMGASFYWFHALAWLGLRRMRQERERACDDRVLAVGVPAVDYAAALAEFAAALAGRPSPLVGSLGMAEQLPLADRVSSILDGSVVRYPASARVRWTLLAATTCLVVFSGVLRPFTPASIVAADTPEPNDKPAAVAKAPKSKAKPAAKSTPPAAKTAGQEPKQLPTKGSMLVRVVGPDGKPIAGAKLFANVSFWDRNATQWNKRSVIKNDHYVTGSDGAAAIKLPEVVEDLRLWASKDGYPSMFATWWPKEQPTLTAIPDEFTYHFETGTVMGGIVKNDDGEPIAGVKVEAMYERKSALFAPSGDVFGTWLSTGEDAIRTNSEGRWKLDNVPPGDEGDVRLKLSHPDYIDDKNWGQLQQEQHVKKAALRAQTAVIVMHRGSIVAGTVTDPEGQPVKDAVVIWGDRPYWEVGSQEVRTDEHGAYRFPPLPPGPMHLTVVAQGWMPERTEIMIASHPHMQSLNFRLRLGKKLRIRLVDQAGAAVSRVAVGISKWHGAESLYNTRHSSVLDTKIPRMSDESGVFEWDWAPDSPVEFNFHREGFAATTASITADGSEQVVTMLPKMRFAGAVVDADTGRPIEQFAAVPVIHFREDFPSVDRNEAEQCTAGRFSLEFDQGDVEHSLQIEAPGYATVRTSRYPIGATVPALELRMKPAPRFAGQVLDQAGRPVANARVYVGSYSEHLYLHELDTEDGGRQSNYRVKTNDRGEFEIAHQLERYALTVVSDEGYGQADRPAGELPGLIKLQRWAKVRGQLMQSGKAVGDWKVRLGPIRDQGGDAPRGSVVFSTQTAVDGSFVFDRAPPVASYVEGFIHFSVKGPLSSSRSAPIAPAPGEEISVSLGGGGAEVTGKLALDPPAPVFDYHFALNYLVARRPAIAPPPAVANKGFDWRRGWSDAWTNSEEGGAYLQTLHHFFVKPDPDGRFRISGVEPGEYHLALRLYGSTEGCLVHPRGLAVVRVIVPEGQSALDLGTIKVPASPGLKVDDAAPVFEFTGIDGARHKLADARGKYVLVDFWATWCGPCVAKMADVESLRQKYADRLGLVVIGANLDQDASQAREFLGDRKLPWQHALLGDWSSTDVPKRFAVSSVPTYVLVDPDGRIAAHETSLAAIAALLDEASVR